MPEADPKIICMNLPPEFRPIAEKYGEGAARMLCIYLFKWLNSKRKTIENYRKFLERSGVPPEIIEKRIKALEQSLNQF